MGREHRPRPLPPGSVHLVSADEPVPDAHDLRRPRLQRLRREARAIEHAAPGPHAAERHDVPRMRPRPWAPGDRRSRTAGTEDARSPRSFQLCLCREPRPRRSRVLGRLLRPVRRAVSRASPRTPRSCWPAGSPKATDDAEAAAWVAVARTVLNLDEFVTRSRVDYGSLGHREKNNGPDPGPHPAVARATS